jgi:hypothetical protein
MGNSLICHCLAFIERIGLVTLFTVFTVTFPARNLFKNLILLFEGDVGLCGTVDAATTDAATMDASSCPFPLTVRRVNLLEPDPLLSRSRAQRCGCPLSRLLRFTRAGGRRAQLPPPLTGCPFPPCLDLWGVPLSPAAGGGSCGSTEASRGGGAGRGSSRFPSESRHPGAASAPPGLASHKCALREEVGVMTAAGGVFPFITGPEPMMEVNPNLFFVLN